MHQTPRVKKTAESALTGLVGKSVPQIAKQVGVDKTTIYRQLNGKGLTADLAISISRTFDVDMLTLFVELGIINDEERLRMQAGASLGDATDRQLLEEMLRRVDDVEAHAELTDPVPDDLIARRGATVTPIRGSVTDVGAATEDDLFQQDHAANTDQSAGDEEPEST